MKTRCFMLVMVLLVVAPIGFAQQAPGPEFDAYVNKALKDWEVPGVAIAIVKDDRVVLAKGYGVRELNKPEPVDEHTLFAIGSSSKAFTAAAIAILVDQAKLKMGRSGDKIPAGIAIIRSLQYARADCRRLAESSQRTCSWRSALVRV